jgi:hypothetical protein
MTNDFEEEPKGVVVSMDPEAFAGYLYNIWFPYTRENVRKIREGLLLGVKNFNISSTTALCSRIILQRGRSSIPWLLFGGCKELSARLGAGRASGANDPH